MSIKTIAEFVENQQIMDSLSKTSVDYAQGYHIAKPTPIEEMFPISTDHSLKKAG